MRAVRTDLVTNVMRPRLQNLETTGVRLVREYCGTQCCPAMHRKALAATGTLANRLMQLSLRTSGSD